MPEIDGTFIELEAIAEKESDFSAALGGVRASLTALGIADADLTTELYTDAVAAAAASRS